MEHTINQIVTYEYSLNKDLTKAILAGCLGELRTTHIFPLPEQFIGIEIEVEQVPKLDLLQKTVSNAFYNLVQDGSLRNNGIEIVTRPLTANCLETLLHKIFIALPAKADFSPRTSIHIHMNVRNLTFSELTSIVYIYIAVEKLLYKFIGANRHKSIFCVPIQETELPLTLNQFLKTKAASRLHWFKYTGMNLLPIYRFGTLEFRHLHGTRDVNLILEWISILQHIFAYAINNKPELIIENLLNINSLSTFRIFIEQIFQNHTQKLLYPGFERHIEQGVSYLKSFVFPNDFLAELQDSASISSTLGKRLYKVEKKANSPLFNNPTPTTIAPQFRPTPVIWDTNPATFLTTNAFETQRINP